MTNIPTSLTNYEIEQIFEKFGAVESAYRVSIQSCKRGSGFGYVTFQQPEPAELLTKVGKVVHGKSVMIIRPYDVEKAGKGKQPQQKTTKDEGETNSSQGTEKGTKISKNKSAIKSAEVNRLTEDYLAVSKPTTKLYLNEREGQVIDHLQSNLSFKIKMSDPVVAMRPVLDVQQPIQQLSAEI